MLYSNTRRWGSLKVYAPTEQALDRQQIVRGLRDLGVVSGDLLMVHSSLAAIGPVAGGADTVIDALLEAVGPYGLVAMPSFSNERPFDPQTSPTPFGAIAEAFWRRPEARRSKHPTHSVAAIGPASAPMLRNHESADTGYGDGTPYMWLARQGGKVLLMGVDQDRNTTLHAAEALAAGAYLDETEATFVDNGREITIPVASMAGPHRDFIGLEPLFRSCGIISYGRIGTAVCRVMDAGEMIAVTLQALQQDPAAVLCSNPACEDCVLQRGRIKAARLAAEDFTLLALADDISDTWPEVLLGIRGEGINTLQVTSDSWARHADSAREAGVLIHSIRAAHETLEQDARLAREAELPLVIPAASSAELDAALQLHNQGQELLVENAGARDALYADFFSRTDNGPNLAFNPAAFAEAGQKPFLQVFYRGLLRRKTGFLTLEDGVWSGRRTHPGRGNGEVKEILSILTCRSFTGGILLRSPARGIDDFRSSAAAFWTLLDAM